MSMKTAGFDEFYKQFDTFSLFVTFVVPIYASFTTGRE